MCPETKSMEEIYLSKSIKELWRLYCTLNNVSLAIPHVTVFMVLVNGAGKNIVDKELSIKLHCQMLGAIIFDW
jgi:ABC-type uncharacterized transport system ATPase subunit